MRGAGVLSLLLAAAVARCGAAEARATSVRGWNSYNGWGGAVNETVLLAVADFMQARARRRRELQPRRFRRGFQSGGSRAHGRCSRRLTWWSTATLTLCSTRCAALARQLVAALSAEALLSQGWSKRDGQILTDAFGRPTPNADMYPSAANGAGFKPLTDALATRGLKLGLWFMRGVPRSAASERLPIAGSSTNSTCLEAARFDKPCFWSTSCHGSSYPSAAADEYYRSVARLLNEWGVEFVKVRTRRLACVLSAADSKSLARPTASFPTCRTRALSRTATMTRISLASGLR